jgi:hypothetical protein
MSAADTVNVEVAETVTEVNASKVTPSVDRMDRADVVAPSTVVSAIRRVPVACGVVTSDDDERTPAAIVVVPPLIDKGFNVSNAADPMLLRTTIEVTLDPSSTTPSVPVALVPVCVTVAPSNSLAVVATLSTNVEVTKPLD